MASAQHEPGSHVQFVARGKGWNLKKTSVMVEGDTDVSYFELASKLYSNKHDKKLVGDDFSTFSPGTGDEGGTPGIIQWFPTLKNLIDIDVDTASKKCFRIAVLVDGDSAGKMARKALLAANRSFVENRDVFVLHRTMPRSTREPTTLTKQIEKSNKGWKSIDCEIEDLIEKSFLDEYFSENPRARRNLQEVNGAYHVNMERGYKGELFRYVEKYAIYEDIKKIIDIVRSLRFYLGVDPDGVL